MIKKGIELLGGVGKILKALKPRPISSMSKAEKAAIEDDAFKLYSDRTKALESGGGNIDDVNPLGRVRNEEMRAIVKKHGFDSHPEGMGVFGRFNTKNLKRFRGGKLTPEDKAQIKKFDIGSIKKAPGSARIDKEKKRLMDDF